MISLSIYIYTVTTVYIYICILIEELCNFGMIPIILAIIWILWALVSHGSVATDPDHSTPHHGWYEHHVQHCATWKGRQSPGAVDQNLSSG